MTPPSAIVTSTTPFPEGKGDDHVDHDAERGAGATFAACWRRRGPEPSQRDIPRIGVTAFWITGLLMLLSLGVGLLVGTSWNIHALDRRYRSLATERRELDEWHRALQEVSRHQRAASGVLT